MKSDAKEGLAARAGSVDFEAAWNAQPELLRGAFDKSAFREGWFAAMESIWDRLPMPEFAKDPMTPREVAKLLDFVKRNLPPNASPSATPNPEECHE